MQFHNKDRNTLLFLAGLVCLALIPSSIPQPGQSNELRSNRCISEQELQANPFQFVIALNSARQEELTLLPGIGPALAEKIIQYRESNGPFETKSQLLQVHGIGPKKMAELEQNFVTRY